MNKDTLILVVYLAVAKMTENEIITYIKKCKMNVGIEDNSKDVKMFFVPIRVGDTKIECINPQFLDKKDYEQKTGLILHQMETSLEEFLDKNKVKESKKTVKKILPKTKK